MTTLIFCRDGRRRNSGTALVGHEAPWAHPLPSPDHRGEGIGRDLMEAAEIWCRDRGVPKIQLLICSTNTKVQSFYEHLGYEVQERVVMSKELFSVTGYSGPRD